MPSKTTLLKLLRSDLNVKLAQAQAARDNLKAKRIRVVEREETLADVEDAQRIIQAVAQAVQNEAHKRIATIVSRCLAAVFEDPYEFRIEFERKRGKTEALLKFVRGGLILEDPIHEAGGGTVDVAAFGLRLACMLLQKPPLRRLLVLDEPFKNIRGAGNRKRVRKLIEALADELGVQFVFCVDPEAYPQFLLGEVVEIG